MKNPTSIYSKMVMQGILVSHSPFLIGSGMGDDVDIEIIKLPDGRPFVPGSSFAGVLKRLIADERDTDDVYEYLWGTDKPKGKRSDRLFQSHVIVDNLECADEKPVKIAVRDGVRINAETGTAEPAGKYDYELAEPGGGFTFRLEVTIREAWKGLEDGILVQLGTIMRHLKNGIRLGANTNTGFGLFRAEKIESAIFKFDSHEVNDAQLWFEYLRTGVLPPGRAISEVSLDNAFRNGKKWFGVKARFRLKSSLLTATYGVDPLQPDKTHLKSNGKFVLSGKSIRGAVRHRALKILNTLERPDAESLLGNLFGQVDTSQGKQVKPKKGRLLIEESIIDDAVVAMEQPRIRINRYLGSAADSALFSSEAVWKKGDADFEINFAIKDYTEEEAGLLLLLLKDLWTGDLAIGGEKSIGRGVLEGVEASISLYGREITIGHDKSPTDEDRSLLEAFVAKLNDFTPVKA